MRETFRTGIEDEYGILIQDCREAARGQVAIETYTILDSENRRYFCKITERPDFIGLVGPTLPVVREMKDRGLSYVSAPVPARHGFSAQIGEVIVVLYDFIDADQSYDYDLRSFGKALGEVHEISAQLSAKLPLRGFSSFREEFLLQTLPHLTSTNGGDEVDTALSNVLKKYAEETRAIIDVFFSLKETCGQYSAPFVNTHGDIHGNVLVCSPKDFYIIDWDEMESGPAERDLWLLGEKPEFMDGYRMARPDFMPDTDALKHAVLKNYLEGIPIYLNPILDRRIDAKTRLTYLKKLEERRFNGWMKPKVRQIINQPSS